MARTQITFDGYNLQSSTVIVKDISHEDISAKSLNIQGFSIQNGGKLTSVDFDAKVIKLTGTIKGTSKSNLETNIDNLKRALNGTEKDLDIEYETGTRRYIATMKSFAVGRKYYTIDVIEFSLEFIISNPPFGLGLDTSTLEDLGNTNTFASTVTGTHDGTLDFGGTVSPTPIIKITFNSALGCKAVILDVVDEDGELSKTRIDKTHFEDGDVIEIDLVEGTIQLNGEDIDFRFGFPKFSLLNNRYTLSVIGESYNVDLKFVYNKLWL